MAHLFGTDDLGRDLYARVVHGSSSSVTSALIAVVIGVVIGSLIGLLAGFFEGWTDVILARFIDVLLAIPGFLLAVVIVSALGFKTINAAVATGVTAIAVFARVMRSEVIKVRKATFVEASFLQGGTKWQVLGHPHPAQRFALDHPAGRAPVRTGDPRHRRPRLPRVRRPAAGLGLGRVSSRTGRSSPSRPG